MGLNLDISLESIELNDQIVRNFTNKQSAYLIKLLDKLFIKHSKDLDKTHLLMQQIFETILPQKDEQFKDHEEMLKWCQDILFTLDYINQPKEKRKTTLFEKLVDDKTIDEIDPADIYQTDGEKYSVYKYLLVTTLIDQVITKDEVEFFISFRKKLDLNKDICEEISYKIIDIVGIKDIMPKKMDEITRSYIMGLVIYYHCSDLIITEKEKTHIIKMAKQLDINPKSSLFWKIYLQKSLIIDETKIDDLISEEERKLILVNCLMLSRIDNTFSKEEKSNIRKIAKKFGIDLNVQLNIAEYDLQSITDLWKKISPENRAYLMLLSLKISASEGKISDNEEQFLIDIFGKQVEIAKNNKREYIYQADYLIFCEFLLTSSKICITEKALLKSLFENVLSPHIKVNAYKLIGLILTYLRIQKEAITFSASTIHFKAIADIIGINKNEYSKIISTDDEYIRINNVSKFENLFDALSMSVFILNSDGSIKIDQNIYKMYQSLDQIDFTKLTTEMKTRAFYMVLNSCIREHGTKADEHILRLQEKDINILTNIIKKIRIVEKDAGIAMKRSAIDHEKLVPLPTFLDYRKLKKGARAQES